MKKILLIATIVVAGLGAGTAGYSHYQQSQINPEILENIEALSSGESFTWDGDQWTNNPTWLGRKPVLVPCTYTSGGVDIWNKLLS